MCSFGKSDGRRTSFERALEVIKLKREQEMILKQRYARLIWHLRWRCKRIAYMFHISRTIITVGSLVVPALLSIQYTSAPSIAEPNQIYWVTWVISLFVTMCNGLLTLFKLDKRYYFLHTTLEQLISEGWQFIQLTGKYSGFYTPGEDATHENQFIFFCHSVEKIRMRQVEEEYFKLSEAAQPGQQGHAHPTNAGPTTIVGVNDSLTSPSRLVPPTPLKQELARVSDSVARAIQEQVSKLTTESGQDAAGAGTSENKAASATASQETDTAPRTGYENRGTRQMPMHDRLLV
jgi:hypothetical protein